MAPPVIDLCIAHNIVVLDHVSYKALAEISLATRADILTYVQDADEVSFSLTDKKMVICICIDLFNPEKRATKMIKHYHKTQLQWVVY